MRELFLKVLINIICKIFDKGILEFDLKEEE